MSRLKKNLLRNSFEIILNLTIIINLGDVIAAASINGVSELSFIQQQHQPERSPNQLLLKNEYELGDEVKKCRKVRDDNDIFVMPFTTHDDPIRIIVTNNALDQIIAHIFGLICQVMGYQKILYVPWVDKKIVEYGNNEGIMSSISSEGASIAKITDNLNISISFGVRYLPESHMSYDHGIDLGALTKPGFYGLYRVSNRALKDLDTTYNVLRAPDHNLNEDLLKQLDTIADDKFMNESLCPVREKCSIILAQYKEETEFIEEYINAYQLKVQVFWLGSRFKEKLRSFVADQKNTFYVLNWAPSDITHVILGTNATLIQMPSCNDIWHISQPQKHLKCMFHPIPQIKFANEKIKKISSLELYLKEQFTFTNDQYLGIIKDFEAQNMTIEEFACHWLSNHPEFYRKKIKDTESQEDFNIILALISPLKHNPLLQAAEMAIKLIEDQKWLKKFHLKGYEDTDHFNQVEAMKTTSRLAEINAKVVIGPSRTSEVQIVADITNMANIPLITYVPSVALNNKDYSHTLHMIGDNTIYVNVTLALMDQFSWRQMAILTEAGLSSMKYVAEMKTRFSCLGYSLLEHSFKNGTDMDVVTSLTDIMNKDYKIIFIDVRPENYMKVIHLAKNETLYKKFFQTCVWITPVNLIELDINPQQESDILHGTLSIVPAPYGNLGSFLTYERNKVIGDWKQEFERNISSNKMPKFFSNYAGFVYDSVLSLGLAFQRIEQQYRHLLAPLGNSQNLTDILVDILRQRINFTGVTGPVFFDEFGKRPTNFEIWQYLGNGSYKEVGVFDYSLAQLNHDIQRYEWKDDAIPLDRSYCGFGVPCKHSSLVFLLVFGSFLVITLPLLSFLHFQRNYKRKIAEAEQKYLESCDEFKLARWEISPSDIDIGRTLGRGHYAKVCLATLRRDGTERQVAVKQLRRQSSRYLREFFYEAEILKGIDHENIVKLLGVYFDHGNFHIVMEYLENDNLNKFLKTRRRLVFDNYYHVEISSHRLTGFAIDVAAALCHLEKCKIVHCDIASRNVLLSGDCAGRKKAKLTDFGLSLDTTRLANYRPRDSNMNPEMPVRLMAPETLRNKDFTFKSDIWSFGVLLYEITTFGGVPYANIQDTDVVQHVLDGNALVLPQDVMPKFKSLVESCLQHDPQKRPVAETVRDILTRNPDLIVACPDPNVDPHAENISSPYHPDTGYSTSNGIMSRSPPHSRARTITYSSLATSDYSEMRGMVPPSGAYIPADMIVAGNYQASNSSTSPLLNDNNANDYLQMSPLMQTNGTAQNHDRNDGDENT